MSYRGGPRRGSGEADLSEYKHAPVKLCLDEGKEK